MKKSLFEEGNNKTAIQEFYSYLDYEDKGSSVFFKAKICYINDVTKEIMYKSKTEILIQIVYDTNSTNIIIRELLKNPACYPEFSTSFQEMLFEDGMLVIKGDSYQAYPAYRLYIM